MNGDNYFHFNKAIADVFFDGRYRSLPIYLDLEDKERNEVSEKTGLPPNDFDQELGAAVSKTICWDKSNIYEWHINNLHKWKASEDLTSPPFSALLLTFSLAAEHMRQGDNYSANNYYVRLAQLYDVSDETKKRKLSAAGKDTQVFWHTLNEWLQETDFSFGRPTAKQVNSWAHVSYSLSQSLVREGDKKNLQKMFAYFGFSPCQILNSSEMLFLLNEWMSTTGPSAWLKKLWGNNNLRDRVVDAACSELEIWEGDQAKDFLLDPVTKLTIAIALRKFPEIRVNLFLITTIDDTFDGDSLKLTNDPVTSQLKAPLNNGNELWLTELSGTRVAYLDPTSELNLSTLINSSFELQGKKGRKYKHNARPVIPLIKLDGSAIYREIPTISLFESHILVCHKNWQSIVENYLNKYARPGYSIPNDQEIKGLPLEWVIFTDVEIINITNDDVSDDLQCLVPLSEGEFIYLTGGLKLEPGLWHAMAPPEVFASNENGVLDVQIKKNEFVDELDPNFLNISDKYNPSFLKKMGKELDSKNLTLLAKSNGKTLEKYISFRTALTPKKLITHRNLDLFYCLEENNKSSFYSAEEIKDSNKKQRHIRGLSFFGTEPELNQSNELREIELIDLQFESNEDWRNYNLTSVNEDKNACFFRGFHHWLVTYENTGMTCSGCGQFQIVRKKSSKRSGKRISPPLSIEVQPKQSDKISIDIAYDAICFFGSGNWNKIQSILSESVDLPWYVSIANQNLVDFGYIDQSLKKDRFTPDCWSCSPPMLTITEHDTAFISGFRNEILIDDVKNALASITVDYKIINNSKRFLPSSHVWYLKETELSVIKSLTTKIRDPNGRALEVQCSSGSLITRSLPLISKILEELPIIHIENVASIEKFDLKSGKWTNSKLSDNGAYRTNFAGRRYFYYKNDKSREATHELVKLMAAREYGIYLHQYNLNESSLECVIGCDPPGLFRRALISCSGELPEVKNGKTVYTKIPRSLGKLIMYKLYT